MAAPEGKIKSFSLYSIRMVRDRSISINDEVMESPERAYAVLRRYFHGLDREHFVTALLDARHHMIGLHPTSVGTLDMSVVHPRETFKAAIVANASGIILAHNHPSGDPSPSREDIELTRRLIGAGRLLGIPVHDHLIIGGSGYLSLNMHHAAECGF